jgi:hypothetical protein
MARIRSAYLICAAIIGIFGHGAAAKSGDASKQAEKAVYEAMPETQKYAENVTIRIDKHPPGWYPTEICAGIYCLFSNRDLARGRGMVMISTAQNFQRLKRIDKQVSAPQYNTHVHPPPFYLEADPEGGERMVANQTIRRGTALTLWTPVLLLQANFFNETSEADQTRLLDGAIQLLPDATRNKLMTQVDKYTDGNLKKFITLHPFESDLGTSVPGSDHGKHTVCYPEAVAYRHDCRPNVAFYIDSQHAIQSTVVRKVQPGEQLTISYINPFKPRSERRKTVEDWRGTPCSCSHCMAGGNLLDLAKSDTRINELSTIEAELKDPDSKSVNTAMIARFLELFAEDRLQVKLADAYQLAALNYNNLGFSKRATKYANLAVQAGYIEHGPDSNDAIAMRILANYPTEHYSYRARIKKRTPPGGK